MVKRRRRSHPPSFKAKVAMDALRADKTTTEIAQEYDVHPNQIQQWKNRLTAEAERLFERSHGRGEYDAKEKVQKLHAKIGELTMERDSLSKALGRNT